MLKKVDMQGVMGRSPVQQWTWSSCTSDHMSEYRSTKCGKKHFGDFKGFHDVMSTAFICCDVCKKQCQCGKCDENIGV